MNAKDPFFWDSALGAKDNIDRVILRQFVNELKEYSSELKNSDETYSVGNMILNIQMLLSERALPWLSRGLPESWDGQQFRTAPVNLSGTIEYFKFV